MRKVKSKEPDIGGLWIRVGDADDYEEFASLSDAAESVGESLATMALDVEEIYWRHDGAGFEIVPGFTGNNYVSAYWGDKEANLVAGLTKKEQKKFNASFKKQYNLTDPR